MSLPKELMFNTPSDIAVLADSRRYLSRNQPYNASIFTSGETIKINLGGVGFNRNFIDPRTFRLNFRSTFTTATAGGAHTANNYCVLLGSGYSYFTNYVTRANGSVNLDEIANYNVLCNALINNLLNSADIDSIGTQIGKMPQYKNTNAGHLIGAGGVNDLVHNYSLPLLGMIGSGCSTYIPVGYFNELAVELTVDTIANIINGIGEVGGRTSSIATMILSNVELTYDIIEVSPSVVSMLDSLYPQAFTLKTRSYVTSTGFLNAQSSGTHDITIGVKKQSLKNMIMSCVPQTAGDKKFGSVCPNLGPGSGFNINGSVFPTSGIDVINKPSLAISEVAKAFGTQNVGLIEKSAFYRSSTAQGLFTDYYEVPTAVIAANQCNKSYFGFDLETVPHRDSMVNGANNMASTTQAHLVITGDLADTAHTLYFMSEYDAMINIDKMTKTCILSQ